MPDSGKYLGNARTLEFRPSDGLSTTPNITAATPLSEIQVRCSLAPIMAWLLPALGVRGELVQMILLALRGEHSPAIIADYLTDWGRDEDAAAVRAACDVVLGDEEGD